MDDNENEEFINSKCEIDDKEKRSSDRISDDIELKTNNNKKKRVKATTLSDRCKEESTISRNPDDDNDGNCGGGKSIHGKTNNNINHSVVLTKDESDCNKDNSGSKKNSANECGGSRNTKNNSNSCKGGDDWVMVTRSKEEDSNTNKSKSNDNLIEVGDEISKGDVVFVDNEGILTKEGTHNIESGGKRFYLINNKEGNILGNSVEVSDNFANVNDKTIQLDKVITKKEFDVTINEQNPSISGDVVSCVAKVKHINNIVVEHNPQQQHSIDDSVACDKIIATVD